jgi:hypothetical protein
MNIDDVKVGSTVFCVGGGYRMECRVIDIDIKGGKVRVSDDEITCWLYSSELELDISYNRNKVLESLNI